MKKINTHPADFTMYTILFFVHSAEARNSNKIITTGDDTPKAKTTVVNSKQRQHKNSE